MSAILDAMVVTGLVYLAFRSVSSPALFRSVVTYIVFGLVMALAWARNHAPDLALAETAIGAGLTGALLMMACRQLASGPGEDRARRRPGRRSGVAAVLAASIGALVLAIGWATRAVETGIARAGRLALENLADLGIGNPVTGVLLSFRGYDTLLEMAVLLAAVAGARALTPPGTAAAPPSPFGRPALIDALLAMVVPLSLLVAGYLLRVGGHAPGGAFQAGAVLAAGGVVLILTGRLTPRMVPGPVQGLILTAGLAVFSGVGLVMLFRGHAMLTLPGMPALYVIETALVISIAFTLILLFAALVAQERNGARGGERSAGDR